MRHGDHKTASGVGEPEGANLMILLNLSASSCEPLNEHATSWRLDDDALERPIGRNQLQTPAVARAAWQSAAVQAGETDKLTVGWPYALCQQSRIVIPLALFWRCMVANDSLSAGAIEKTATTVRNSEEQVTGWHVSDLSEPANGVDCALPRWKHRLNLDAA